MANKYDSNKKATECICPKCGKIHIMFLFWTGSGMPKKFCGKHECLLDEDEETYGPNHKRKLRAKGAL
jgi:hypothetical protein